MPRPCDHPIGPPQTDACHVCLLYATDLRHYLLWGGDPAEWDMGADAPKTAKNTSATVSLAVRRKRPAATPPAPKPAVEAAARKSLCLHLLEPTGAMHTCPTCTGSVQVKEFGCAKHGTCVLAKPIQGIAYCGNCPDYSPSAAAENANGPVGVGEPVTAQMSLTGMTRLLEGPPQAWPKGWESWDVTIQAHRALLERAVAAPPPYPTGQFEGRGIIFGAGGATYFSCAMVSVAVLRKLGCALPVEFWCLGAGEIDSRMRELASVLGVTCIDAREVAAALPRPPRILNGWELKPFAIIHSRFEEVLYLDADNVPAADPTGLFDDPDYRTTGAVFWPDLPPAYRPEWLPKRVFDVAGLSPSSDTALESGQLLVNKAMCWREINVTLHLNEHSDFWYGRVGGPDMIYGDKDTFWIAWHKCQKPYAQTITPAGWNYPAIYQHDLDGKLLFQHCCQGKGMLSSGERIACLAHADFVAEAGKALRSKWHGRPWEWSDQSGEEMAASQSLPGIYLYKRVGHDERLMELKPGGDFGAGGAGCERRWSVRVLDDKPTLVISGDSKTMMFLRQDGAGVWCGRWEHHERMPIELERVKV